MTNVIDVPQFRDAHLINAIERRLREEANDRGLSRREQGYIAAIADIVQAHGQLDLAHDLWRSLGKPNAAKLLAAGMDEYDIEAVLILEQHERGQL